MGLRNLIEWKQRKMEEETAADREKRMLLDRIEALSLDFLTLNATRDSERLAFLASAAEAVSDPPEGSRQFC